MAAKTATWLILIGAFVMFVGLLCLPAAFGNNPDETMLGAGLAIFAVGALQIACGLYIKASTLSGQAGSVGAAKVQRVRRSNCDRCGKNEPVIQCRVHQVHLCSDCLSEHYDFRACAYVPSTRRVSAHAMGA